MQVMTSLRAPTDKRLRLASESALRLKGPAIHAHHARQAGTCCASIAKCRIINPVCATGMLPRGVLCS
jgi:hypothetical protein